MLGKEHSSSISFIQCKKDDFIWWVSTKDEKNKFEKANGYLGTYRHHDKLKAG